MYTCKQNWRFGEKIAQIFFFQEKKNSQLNEYPRVKYNKILS